MGDSDKKQTAKKTAADRSAPDGKRQTARRRKATGVLWGRPTILRIIVLTLGIVVLAFAGVAAYRALQRGGPQEPPLPPVIAPVPVLNPPREPVVEIFGDYEATVNIASDPAGHARFIKWLPKEALHATQGSIIVSGSAPWVTVTGPLNPDGTFKATGTGKVAGFPNIKVEFDGSLTATSGLIGDYTMGVGGGLPTNQSITYHIQGKRVEGPSGGAASAGGPTGGVASAGGPASTASTAGPTSASSPAMQDFLTQLTAALRTNDAAFLFKHLHPAAIGLYGAQTCQAHFQQRSPDPTYNIEVINLTGPAPWVYAPTAQAQVPVGNVYTVNAKLTEQGKTTTTAVHIGQVGDQFYWFTACQ